ncbi:DUF3422 family protein [Variovorax sp. HJSM1_2]|uniref:DUF3422 family protein n=1 Tax=Variovorax sp. HJSM1_2 TaxID=3366263 RepID=UPI003BC30B92
MSTLSPHPLRQALHNEIHARPPEPIAMPQVISHIVMVCDAQERAASRQMLLARLSEPQRAEVAADAIHLRLDFGAYRLRWEMHTEFVTYTFMRPLEMAAAEAVVPESTALEVVPADWLAALPGHCLVGLHLWALPGAAATLNASADAADSWDGLTQAVVGLPMVPPIPWVKQLLQEDSLVGSTIAGGQAEVYTDYVLHPDGFSRMLLMGRGLSPRRVGRNVQRLLEIETYRMAALLGLPVAREAAHTLAVAERELAALAEAIRSASRNDEPLLLDRLTRLAGQVESQYAAMHSRFSASAAYFELVDKRIADLREVRLGGMQSIREFMERRLSPARSTCEWVRRRQDALSQRVSRVSNLLRTRVEIEQQQSSQGVLTAMNQRQGVQLRMQATVEGLSVAAITYYIVGLVSYLAKGGHALGWPWSAESTAAAAIPVVGLSVWWSMRRLHHKMFGDAH